MIQDGETGVLTGGLSRSSIWDNTEPPTTKVTRYSRTSHQSLPSLNTPRRIHACTSLVIDGKTGSIISKNISIVLTLFDCHSPVQVYLVVGGKDSSNNPISSTELFISRAWRLVDPLPAALSHLSATTVQNIVYVSGELMIYFLYILVITNITISLANSTCNLS